MLAYTLYRIHHTHMFYIYFILFSFFCFFGCFLYLFMADNILGHEARPFCWVNTNQIPDVYCFRSGASFLNRWAVFLAEDNSAWISMRFRHKSLQMLYSKQCRLVPVSHIRILKYHQTEPGGIFLSVNYSLELRH